MQIFQRKNHKSTIFLKKPKQKKQHIYLFYKKRNNIEFYLYFSFQNKLLFAKKSCLLKIEKIFYRLFFGQICWTNRQAPSSICGVEEGGLSKGLTLCLGVMQVYTAVPAKRWRRKPATNVRRNYEKSVRPQDIL